MGGSTSNSRQLPEIGPMSIHGLKRYYVGYRPSCLHGPGVPLDDREAPIDHVLNARRCLLNLVKLIQQLGMARQDFGVVILPCCDCYHGVRDLADYLRQALLFGPDLGMLGVRFRQLVKDALALLSGESKIDRFASHGRIMPLC